MFCVMYYNLFDNFLVVPYGCIKKTQKSSIKFVSLPSFFFLKQFLCYLIGLIHLSKIIQVAKHVKLSQHQEYNVSIQAFFRIDFFT